MPGDPPSSDDVVETVQLPSERPAAQPSLPPAESLPTVHTRAGRTDGRLLAHRLDGRGAAPRNRAVARRSPLSDRPARSGDQQDARVRGLSLLPRAMVRGRRVERNLLRLFPFCGSGTSVGDDFAHLNARGSFDPSVRELYLAFFGGSVELRLGQQRVAWGRADTQSPNDVLNARDLRDPFQPEPELAQIPTPLARLDWTPGGVTLEGVVAPFFVPDEFDVYGSNWALVQPGAPQGIRGFFKAMSSLVDLVARRPVQPAHVQQTRIPPPAPVRTAPPGSRCRPRWGTSTSMLTITTDSIGRRCSGWIRRFRTASIVQAGTSRRPRCRISARSSSSIQSRASPPITIEYVRRHHVGFDMGTVVRPHRHADRRRVRHPACLLPPGFSPASPAPGKAGFQGVASLSNTRRETYEKRICPRSLRAPASVDDLDDLMFVQRTTVTGAALLRYPLSDRVRPGAPGAAVSAMPKSTVLRPQIGWRARQRPTSRSTSPGSGSRAKHGAWATTSPETPKSTPMRSHIPSDPVIPMATDPRPPPPLPRSPADGPHPWPDPREG